MFWICASCWCKSLSTWSYWMLKAWVLSCSGSAIAARLFARIHWRVAMNASAWVASNCSVLLTLLDRLHLPLGRQPFADQLAPFGCGDFPKLHMLDQFPIEPHLLPFCVCAHASLAYAVQLRLSRAYPCKWYRTPARSPWCPNECRTSSLLQTWRSWRD